MVSIFAFTFNVLYRYTVAPCEGSGSECGVHGALTVVSVVAQLITNAWSIPCGGLLMFGPCYSCSFRKKIRAKYSIMEQAGLDCVLHYFCQPCVLCQVGLCTS